MINTVGRVVAEPKVPGGQGRSLLVLVDALHF